ncbi:protein kinase-like domain, Phloem protein 2-like protein [Artemisia annua]|uniref:Protein kinase-like domain, Phloem protein 2-like protein n=1 Tax=Artemisia annua TaxID=35608 RepID=A0A2U1QFL5_ARTAN|nr:protein kinase-like domain, Phloem protein 2-like protein [Artemisia annua]
MWKKSYKEKKLDEIVFQDLKQQLDPSSLETFADIAYQCLQNSREQRPAMSHVVEKLKSALELQEVHDMKLPKEYAEIVKSTVDRLTYTSLEELEALLSKWVILNGGKTLFSINDKREHCERICIEGCLNLDEIKDGSLEYPSHYYNSRFPGGRCYEYKNEFKARVRADFLSPQITYTVNLVFRHKCATYLPKLAPIRYKLDGETKLIPENVEDDEVLEYEDIIKAASHSLAYRSLAELKVLLSKGIHLNEYKRWFSLNEKGDNCEMISVAECLIPDESNKDYVFHYEPAFHYEPRYLSRFPTGPYKTMGKGFGVHVKAQFLSPLTTYTVNLVFSYPYERYRPVHFGLQYKLEGETEPSTVYLADPREDGLLWAELYQFTSDGRSVDLIITFKNFKDRLEVEGVMFQPLEKIENQLLEDEKVDMQTVMDSEIMKVSKDSTEWKMKKDRYSILWQCFRIENSQERFSVDKNGKKCLKLSARAACYLEHRYATWESSPNSSFGEVLEVSSCRQVIIHSCIKSQVLSPETAYACYFVYKLPQDQSTPAALMEVNRESDSWYICLSSPPNTPVIGQKLDKNRHNSSSRPKLNAKPQQRSDGWMEVKLWEFQTETTFRTVSLRLTLRPIWSTYSRIILEGIELRPI